MTARPNSLFFNIFFILKFGAFFVNGNFEFIFEEIEKCKKEFGKELSNFERKIYNKNEWEKIEPREELDKCKIEFDVVKKFEEIEAKLKNYHDELANRQRKMPENEEFKHLSGLSNELMKMHLEKNLMEILKAKLGIVAEKNKGENNALDKKEKVVKNSKSNSVRGTESEPIRLKLDNKFEMEIDAMADSDFRNDSPRKVKNEILLETNENRKQILESLFEFRQKLNNEVKWLNAMIWFKKPKIELENLMAKLEAQKNEIGDILDEFVTNKEMQLNVYEKISEKAEKIKADFGKRIKGITGKWNKIRAKKTAEKVEKLRNELRSQGEFTKARELNDYIIWPLYDELVRRIQRALGEGGIGEVDLKGVKWSSISIDQDEEDAVIRLEELIGHWNEAVKKAQNQIDNFVGHQVKEEYAKLWKYFALNYAISLIIKEIMGIFAWDEVELKLARIWFLAREYAYPYLTILSENYKMLVEELKGFNRQIGREKRIQIEITNEALKVLEFCDWMNKLHKIEESNEWIRERDEKKREKYLKLRGKLDSEFEEGIPQKILVKKFWEIYLEIEKIRREMQPKIDGNL